MANACYESVAVTAAADGSATVYSAGKFTGAIRLAKYTKNNFSDGAVLLITSEDTGQTIWSQTGVNASASISPRQALSTTAGVASLYAAGGTAINGDIVLCNERIKIVLTGAGNATTAAYLFVVEGSKAP